MGGTCLLCSSAGKQVARGTFLSKREQGPAARNPQRPAEVAPAAASPLENEWGLALEIVRTRGSRDRSSNRLSRTTVCESSGNGVRVPLFKNSREKQLEAVSHCYGATPHRKAAGGYRYALARCRSLVAGICNVHVVPTSKLVTSQYASLSPSIVFFGPQNPLCVGPLGQKSRQSAVFSLSTSDEGSASDIVTEPPAESSNSTPDAPSQRASGDSESAGPSGRDAESESSVNFDRESDARAASNGTSPGQDAAETPRSTRGFRRETVLPHRQLREEIKGRRSTKPWRPSRPEKKSTTRVLAESHYKNQVSGPSGRESEPWSDLDSDSDEFETDSEDEEEEQSDYVGVAPHLEKLPEPRRGVRKATMPGQRQEKEVRGTRLLTGVQRPKLPRRRRSGNNWTAFVQQVEVRDPKSLSRCSRVNLRMNRSRTFRCQ